MATAEKILEIARSQIGTRESPANSDNVKYNTVYYGREVSGKYPWCAVFVWWVFREAVGLCKAASCTAFVNRYKAFAPGPAARTRPKTKTRTALRRGRIFFLTSESARRIIIF